MPLRHVTEDLAFHDEPFAPEPRAGVAQFAHSALNLYYGTDEAMEGRNAFVEKRPVDFGKFRT